MDDDADGYGAPGNSVQFCAQPSGHVDNDADCDDGNSSLHPDTPWYADSDGDGFGDLNNSTNSCTQPSGHISDSTDCDDTDAQIHPDTVWFLDSDGDSYGDPSSSVQSCTQPTGYVLDSTDCDDADFNSGFCIMEEVNFTPCGATGPSGPAQSDCDSAYSGTTLDGDVSVSGGIQTWTVHTTGDYVITAAGADGGTNTDHGNVGGYGASMEGTFSLTAGQVLEIVVGQSGLDGGDNAGGGGGTFVVVQGASTPLIVAGGGGGGAEDDDNSTSMTTYKNGVTGECAQAAPRHGGGTNPGGCNGDGGSNDPHQYGQGAGAGFLTDGDNGNSSYCNGSAFANGAAGCSNGGFGGGGHGGGDGGGGAGGYSGGAGGSGGGGPDGPGGGGGSFNAGTNQTNSDGANNGAGFVTIDGA